MLTNTKQVYSIKHKLNSLTFVKKRQEYPNNASWSAADWPNFY